MDNGMWAELAASVFASSAIFLVAKKLSLKPLKWCAIAFACSFLAYYLAHKTLIYITYMGQIPAFIEALPTAEFFFVLMAFKVFVSLMPVIPISLAMRHFSNAHSQPHANPDIAMYTPIQIALGSFLGGPISAIYFLWANYQSLGNDRFAKRTLVLGSMIMVPLFAVLPYLPDAFPPTIIPLLYAITARELSRKTQLSSDDIQEHAGFVRASNWEIIAISVIGLIATMILIAMFVSLQFV